MQSFSILSTYLKLLQELNLLLRVRIYVQILTSLSILSFQIYPLDTIMDLLNCGVARRAILDYYQRSGEPLAVQEAIKTSQEKASKTVTMEKMKMMYVLS